MPLCFLIKCKKEESLNKRESTCQYLFFLKLIGSLVLLIYGMKTVSEALQKLTGGHLRHILGAMTTNRFTGLLTGASYSLPLQQIVSLEEDEYHLVDPNKSFNIENERNNYRNQLKDQNVLEPAMQWKSIISYIKTVEPGTSISYGGTFTAKEKMTVATIPVGYADGMKRDLSGKGRVLIHGQYAPILGRICMDQIGRASCRERV